MKHKRMRTIRLVLDLLMFLASLTMFSKSFFGIFYHEVAGLSLVALCAVHIGLNFRTVRAMCRKFVRVPLDIRAGLIVDIFLILCYLFIGVSGVMISKTVLTGISSRSMIFRFGHTFASALSVILLGIHIGLHIVRKPMIPFLAGSLTVLVLYGGIWGLRDSSELRWLSSGFSAGSKMQGTDFSFRDGDFTLPEGMEISEGMEGRNGRFSPDSADIQPDSVEGGDRFSRKFSGGESDPPSVGGDAPEDGAAFSGGNSYDRSMRPDFGDSSANGFPKDGSRGAEHGSIGSSLSHKLSSAAMFGGMILSCAMGMYWILVLWKSRRRKIVSPQP